MNLGFSHTRKSFKKTPACPRPLSPHLSIYKWNKPLFFSITHRFSEAALYVVAWFLSAALLLNAPTLCACLHTKIGVFFAWLGSVLLCYHLQGTLRHLLLHLGFGFRFQGPFSVHRPLLFLWALSSVFLWRVFYV